MLGPVAYDLTGHNGYMNDSALEDEGSDFGASVIENFFLTWVEPELMRRDVPVDRATVWAAVVELLPGGGHNILLNE